MSSPKLLKWLQFFHHLGECRR